MDIPAETLQYRIKPGAGTTVFPTDILVAAVRVSSKNKDEIVEWCGGEIFMGEVLVPTQVVEEYKDDFNNEQKKVVPGKSRAFVGDYVVRWQGRFFVCNAQAFESAYNIQR
jgi:hypothetical protein